MRRLISALLSVVFLFSNFSVYAQNLNLPQVGSMVSLSESFTPVILRGMTVHPDKPLSFDFIVDTGDSKQTTGSGQQGADALQPDIQRLVNYFLAALTVPEGDLWVNLSPFEKDRIITDEMSRTELGRDLLAQDYVLKQLTASLIYPEGETGKIFWAKVYDQAYQKFGVTDIPTDVFNKVWIMPDMASVYEKNGTVFVAKAHMKVMLESDYLAQRIEGDRQQAADTAASDQLSVVPEMTKQLLREVVLPAIEKEVNEGKNFALLRQVFHSLILAQWYKKAFAESALKKAYADKNKVAGVDVSDPALKDTIYQQYLAAYKQGVFNYIKEETDRLTGEPLPKKYFSGGFTDFAMTFDNATIADVQMAARGDQLLATVDMATSSGNSNAISETSEEWNNRERALPIFAELQAMLDANNGKFSSEQVRNFLEKYIPQVERDAVRHPVQCTWPVLKALVLLTQQQENMLIEAIDQIYAEDLRLNRKLPLLVDVIRLMAGKNVGWQVREARHMKGSKIYTFTAEGYPAEGGLGEVAENILKGFVQLEVPAALVQPRYFMTPQGKEIDYESLGLDIKKKIYDEFTISLGQPDGTLKPVNVKVTQAIDKNGAEIFLYWSEERRYTNVVYNYNAPFNPISKEESMSFLNEASAAFFYREERKRRKEQKADWRPAVVDANDGQLLPLIPLLESRYGHDIVVRDSVSGGKNHTVFNSGENNQDWGVDIFLKRMLRISAKFVNAFRIDYKDALGASKRLIDHTFGGLKTAVRRMQGVVAGVSNIHAEDMEKIGNGDSTKGFLLKAMTNGANPEKLAKAYREEFKKLQDEGKISADADFERPTGQENMLTKQACKLRLNALGLKTAIGRTVRINPLRMLMGYMRRAVGEKDGRRRAFHPENIRELVARGEQILLVGRDQGPISDDTKAVFMALEQEIADEKAAAEREGRKSKYEGDFFFVTIAGPEVKPDVLAALDVMIQDSDGPEDRWKYGVKFKNTGAAEYSEEYPAGAYVGGGQFGPGVITDQGIHMRAVERNGRWQFVSPGDGNTLIPEQDTKDSWMKTVYEPLMELYQSDPVVFYEGAAKTNRMIRIMSAAITSAANVRAYDEVKERMEIVRAKDETALQAVIASLAGKPKDVRKIMRGENKMKPFGFQIVNDRFEAADTGLSAFVAEVNKREEEFGYDAMIGNADGPYQDYLRGMFAGTAALADLERWFLALDQEDLLLVQKNYRVVNFLTLLQGRLEEKFLNALITQQDAAYLLSQAGDSFSWQRAFGDEEAKSGKGLQDFVNHYFGLIGEERSAILDYHNRPRAQDILEHARDFLEKEPLLWGLRETLQPEFDKLSLGGIDEKSEKLDVTERVMQALSRRVQILDYRQTMLRQGRELPLVDETDDSAETAILSDGRAVPMEVAKRLFRQIYKAWKMDEGSQEEERIFIALAALARELKLHSRETKVILDPTDVQTQLLLANNLLALENDRIVMPAYQAIYQAASYFEGGEWVLKDPLTGGAPEASVLLTDAAEVQKLDNATGGIEMNNIDVAREGDLIQNVADDAALTRMIESAPGLRAVIISITPLTSVLPLLGLSREDVAPMAAAQSAEVVALNCREEDLVAV